MPAHDYPRIPDQEFADRLANVRQKMEAASLDLLVLYSNLLDPSHVRYLADVYPINESAAVIVPLAGDAIMCSGQACHAWSVHKSKIKDVRVLPEIGEVAGTEYEIAGQVTFASLFQEIKAKYPVRRIGTVGTLTFPQVIYRQLSAVFPDAELTNAEPLMYQLRVVKSPNEIACMRRAANILDASFANVVDKMQPGWTELDIHAEIQAAILKGGAENTAIAWNPMIPSGPQHTQLCMNMNTLRQVQEGEIIDLQSGACYEGYNAALCYPMVLGAIPAEIKAAVRVAGDSMAAIIEHLKAGVTSRQLNAAGRGVLERAGLSKFSPYGQVHCIGLLECESPWLPVDQDFPIVEGMTLACDVFLFGLPWGSFRIENTFAVTADGHELLTQFNKDNLERIIHG
jgi:Xaa-Pro aminopeptidase